MVWPRIQKIKINNLRCDITWLQHIRRTLNANGIAGKISFENIINEQNTINREELVSVLTKHKYNVRTELISFYKQKFYEDLRTTIDNETIIPINKDVKDVMLGLLTPPLDFLCEELNKALTKWPIDEQTLIDTLCTLDRQDLRDLLDRYHILYGNSLEEDISSKNEAYLMTFLLLKVKNAAKDAASLTLQDAKTLAETLYNAGEGVHTTDEDVFINILGNSDFAHIKYIAEEYRKLSKPWKKSGRSLRQAVLDEFSQGLKKALVAVLDSAENPATYFAQALHNALQGPGTDDAALKRIIVHRSETDLDKIKKEYVKLYSRTLAEDVEADTSGEYTTILLAIINRS
uniref:Annexin n=1 Tax=Clastoptera arizonana TaxID=38151 RepID=A0A1B6DX02_9HEMI